MSAFVPGPAAVLVIDLQEALFRSLPPPHEGDAIIQRINRVTSAARSAGVPIIFFQHDGELTENLVPFTPGWNLHSDLEREPKDLVIRKDTCDAFFETSLESELYDRGIKNLILTGYATEFCIDATVRGACSRGLKVLVVSDAHTTHDNPVLPASQVIRLHNWAWPNCAARPGVTVLPANELTSAWLGR
jgi:nicotinamidase-related amidase